ncbi:MAG TPA: pyrroloquinoline-quinone synthase PqqC [Nitrospiraceae bacterium]|nr:pyrroloquinoline-quinone synthase PqqC [Nitrospiraceae bacterium]
MNGPERRPPLNRTDFLAQLRTEGERRYHHRHPFHQLMHAGRLTRHQLQQWVLNRYYYQTRIPIKDALILAKSEDPSFRRIWIRRIQDHDGIQEDDGGLALWRRLARGVGLDEDQVSSLQSVLPDVRAACDSYVAFVREAPLLEAVASSLTELFAPDLMSARLAAWERHYPWVDPAALEYFRARISRARHDSDEALTFVLSNAQKYESQMSCIAALIRKTDILWRLLDAVHAAYAIETTEQGIDHDGAQPTSTDEKSAIAARPNLR